MWGQSLDTRCTAHEARRIEVRAALTTTSSSNTPSPNKTPRKKTRSSSYGPLRPFPLDIPALQQNYGGPTFPCSQVAGRPPILLQQWMPPQWDEQLCVDNFPSVAIHTANMVSSECDWARVGKCLVCNMAGPSLIKCQMDGCVRHLHHMRQTGWESANAWREAHFNRKLCAYHHPALTGQPAPLH
jgi:hypothetical protein